MSIQYRFFSIPVNNELDAEEEFNELLRAVNAVVVHRELICQENRYYWAMAVEYATGSGKKKGKVTDGGKKIDYKEVLSPGDFAIYAQLRDWRKERAVQEGVKLYNVFMNDQLAAMVTQRVTSKKQLLEIDGVGRGRVDKYGDAVLAILKEAVRDTQAGDENQGADETDR